MKHFSIRVVGKVQGVFFRASTKETADELGIKGMVRNEPDGSVYIEAEGEDETLIRFMEWCKKGPRMARVERCEIDEKGIQNFKNFSIQH